MIETTLPLILTPGVIILLFWEIIWKGFALYRAGKKQQPVWFILLLILNTAGILPIIYLLTHPDKTSKKKKRKR